MIFNAGLFAAVHLHWLSVDFLSLKCRQESQVLNDRAELQIAEAISGLHGQADTGKILEAPMIENFGIYRISSFVFYKMWPQISGRSLSCPHSEYVHKRQ